ncbi:MAG: hypothetical protein WCT27_02795 [Patescibacteria group bacterium]|jgi:hypothetical protein
MRTEKLTAMRTDELLDLLWLPNQLSCVEEEILVLAELGARYLTPKQKALIRHLVPAARRQYDYRVSSLNGSV